jgi:hypothetical protein
LTTHVALINHSTVVRNDELDPLARALTVQAIHLGKAGYDIVADAQRYKGTPPHAAWQLVILDDADQADALGYHETTPAGQPLGKVFARTVRDAGLSWTVTASHEFVEMLVDPWATLGVDLGGGVWVAWEACDPVEADAFGYDINGIRVSDFITAAWFVDGAPGPYDWTTHCPAPLTLLDGGYVAVQEGGEWQQVLAERPSPDGVSRAEFARRIERRRARAGEVVTA